MLSPYIANITKMDFNLKTTHYTFNVNGPLSMSWFPMKVSMWYIPVHSAELFMLNLQSKVFWDMTVCLRNNLKEYDTRSGIGNVLGRSYQFSFFIKSKVKDTKWNNFNHNSNFTISSIQHRTTTILLIICSNSNIFY